MMRYLSVFIAATLAIFIALAQPGVCSCWLMVDVAHNHPHPDGHPERPHAHDYLADLFSANVAITVLPFIFSILAFIASIYASALWQVVLASPFFNGGCRLGLEPPPPR